jgi:uncharacterized membrane protein
MDLTTLDGWIDLTLGGAAVLAGLLAGIYVAFTVAVMPGLAAGSDRTLVEAMRRINGKILNPWFLAIFTGGAVLPLVAAVLIGIDGERDALGWTIVAAILAIVGFGITAARNVPLNEALERQGSADSGGDPAADRLAFEAPWVRWNRYRTVACTLALVALIIAIAVRG